MELKDLKADLEKNGYSVIFFNGEEVRAGRDGDSDNDLGINTLKEIFTMKLNKEKILLYYQFYQIDKVKSFDSEKDVLEFIKKNYPID